MIQHDVLLVGGGGAGLRAAIAVAESNPDLSVAVASKLYPMRSHTVSAEGGAAAVINPNDTLQDHAYDTISGADWLADQDAVWAFVNEAPREMTLLEHWGCPWSRTPEGRVATRPFGGMKIERTWFAADKTGFHMLHSLFQHSLQYGDITRYDEWFVTDLVIADGRCQGVIALEIATGEIHAIGAKSVILCTGGAGRVFPFTTNAQVKTGDGMALAYRAGVPLKDMEFVQYHPTGLPGTGILITEASRGEGGILLNNKGERYLKNYDLGEPVDITDARHPQKRTMELGPRDRLSQAFYHERQKGNTFEHGDTHIVKLDLRHLGEEKIMKKIPFVRELSLNYVSVDPVHEPIPVRPVVHYVMGGVHTDINASTGIDGLYAAGECACVNINGANRLGSNSLTELLVFGRRAGESASKHVKATKDVEETALKTQLEETKKRIAAMFDHNGKERIADVRGEMHTAMEEGCGIYRSEESLQVTCEKLTELRERYNDLNIADKTKTFNTEIIRALELGYMLDVAEAMAYSAAKRKESRGSHQRSDFTERNDKKYLKHSMATQSKSGKPKIEYSDVVITDWPPGDRTYGVDSGFKHDKTKPAKKTKTKKKGS